MQPTNILCEDDQAPCSCADCNWTGKVDDCEPIFDLASRIGAGETVPCGQCPECGALAHLDDPERTISDARTETLADHLDHLTTYAGNFITHWMEDDGNDADDKARCAEAEEATDDAETKLRAALDASQVMLTALQSVSLANADTSLAARQHRARIHNAIAKAEAAGITTAEA